MIKMRIVMDIELEGLTAGERLMREVMTAHPKITQTALHEPCIGGHQHSEYEFNDHSAGKHLGRELQTLRRGYEVP